MTTNQIILFCILFAAFILFVRGRPRYDIVALLTLLTAVVTGLVGADNAFSGFGHPAIVTVAAVLVISRGLTNAGVVSLLARKLSRVASHPRLFIPVLTMLVALVSAFINNVGALALLMPVSLRLARRGPHKPSRFLMPLAFGSLLGGLITLIGTPPNIIIASFRARYDLPRFGMFDFTPVGLGVALAGTLFIALLGWRLIPVRKEPASTEDLFSVESYMTELRVPPESGAVGMTLRQLEQNAEAEIVVMSLIRGNRKIMAPARFHELFEGDILIVEAQPEDIKSVIEVAGLELVGNRDLCKDLIAEEIPAASEENEKNMDACEQLVKSHEMGLIEAVVQVDSPMVGTTAPRLELRWRYGVNLLAVARQGVRLTSRLRDLSFRAGDVLLLQGPDDTMGEAMAALGCLPLAGRDLNLSPPRGTLLSLSVFAAAIAATALNLLPAHIALSAVALVMLLSGVINLADAYRSIDWPIIVLLGAMLPLGAALETTGGAALVAKGLLDVSHSFSAPGAVALLLIATMLLSNLINNAAAALLMAPIGVNLAQALGASIDPFLMAVAVGASSPFLTPIGHQSNTLVMGPGGYRFGDYWRMGLPLSILVVVTGLGLILFFWPLH